MTVKEYLSRPKVLREEIQCDIDNLAALRSIVEDCTTHLSYKAGCNPSRNKDTFENVMLDIASEEEKIEEKKRRLIRMQTEILLAIRKMKNSQHQAVLRMRYVEDKKWTKISEEMYLTVSRLMDVHREALREFEKTALKST